MCKVVGVADKVGQSWAGNVLYELCCGASKYPMFHPKGADRPEHGQQGNVCRKGQSSTVSHA